MDPPDEAEGDAPHRPRRVSRLGRAEQALAAAAMAAICVISFANVVVRYATDVSFAFTEEYSTFLLVVMTFIGTARAFATNEHLRITFLRDRLAAPGRLACDLVALAACLAMFALIVYHGSSLAYDQWRFGETSPGLGYPTWIYTVWMPLISVLVLGRILQAAARRLGRQR